VRALEIPAERFRAIALERPGLVEHISRVVSMRRTELDEARAMAATPVVAPVRETLFARIQRFLRLP
jgi:CRP-like cAMP-binding protein